MAALKTASGPGVEATCLAGAAEPVCLVGAGPGDPELLTVRAVRRLEAADVVLHDNLISEDVLALVPRRAELINVGKRCGDVKDRGLQQQEIHDLMLAHSRRGRRVVRLKCGDPFVYGRGGEEVEFLAEHGIATEVVPGVTSALGAAASCAVPLTHRSFGVNHVHFVVGQNKAKQLPDLDWAELARNAGKQTTIFYMGYRSLDSICQRLVEHGARGDTPMVLVESATLPTERTVHGTLDTLPKLAKEQEAGTGGPVLFMMGPTAAFPAHLDKLAGGRPWKRQRLAANNDDDAC
mmetsp:Transcript_96743/g.190021  ORF Transcript_96743/g.190021 Transcript_96743/m.190021 type:complete len:293 (+) Transcript_96743:84-962(+)